MPLETITRALDWLKAQDAVDPAGLATTLLAYKDAGHFGVGPPLPEGKDVPFMLTLFGGTEQGNIAARKDGWPRTMAFLEAALNQPAEQPATPAAQTAR